MQYAGSGFFATSTGFDVAISVGLAVGLAVIVTVVVVVEVNFAKAC